MQAILVFWTGVVCGVFAGVRCEIAGPLFCTRVVPRSCQLGRFFYLRVFSYGEVVTFSPRKRFARVGLFSCQPGRENRASPRKNGFRDFQVALRIESNRVNRRFRVPRVAFFPFKRAISRDRRPVKRREKRGFKKPRFPIVFGSRNLHAKSPLRSRFNAPSRLARHGQ